MLKKLFILLLCNVLTFSNTCFASAVTADNAPVNRAIKKWFSKNRRTPECNFSGDEAGGVHLDYVQYFDFDRDGKKEAIVMASTCWSGTAGPDIHSVLVFKGEEILELEVPDPDKKIYDAAKMEGNQNYRLSVEDGLLVAVWHDSSNRKNPLIVKYRWNGGGFSAVSAKIAGQ